jgi:hypothetical protein
MPVVQQTAALRGFRPVANAFGAAVGLTYSLGTGCRADIASSRTIRYIAGCSACDTGLARIAFSASLSELKYAYPFISRAIARPMNNAPRPNSPLIRMINALMPPSSNAVFSPL